MKTFSIFALLITLAMAAPAPGPIPAEFDIEARFNETVDALETRDVATLQKRDTEIVYLANCVDAVSCCRPNIQYSQIIYYPASSQSQNGQVPPNNNRCTTNSGGYTVWEGSARPCTFPTGVTYTSHIDSGAQSRADFSYAGWGNNGKNWNCYKDNQRTLFDPYMPEAANYCKSIYYCLPA